jgi:peptide deformylase
MSEENKSVDDLTSLKIIQYPHPTLRHKSKPITSVDAQLHSVVAEMFDLMYEAKGIGLAANQVDLPLQIFIVNVAGKRDEGEEMVFINPVVSSPKGTDEAEEGCLSIPSVGANVVRPKQVHVNAYDLSGNEINMTVDGMLAKVIQHEHDHLHGVLFIDRVHESSRRQLEMELSDFHLQFDQMRSTGEIPDDPTIQARLAGIEARYCS